MFPYGNYLTFNQGSQHRYSILYLLGGGVQPQIPSIAILEVNMAFEK